MTVRPNPRALFEKYPLSDTRMRHSRGVAAIAFRIASAIAARHPLAGVDPEKVRLAALLHDIGRSRSTGDHVRNSIAVLKEEGLEDLAAIVAHGSAYEESVLEGRDNPALLPDTLENKIVAYADTRFRLTPVTVEERIADIKQRRAGEHTKLRAVEMAMQRYLALERQLVELAGEEAVDPACRDRQGLE